MYHGLISIVCVFSYNCDDQHCYLDLARLRGVKYMTWENMDKLKQEDEVRDKENLLQEKPTQ